MDVVVVVVAIEGNERGVTVSGEANGVRRIARRRESSSGSSVLSGSDVTDSVGDFGGSAISGSWGSGAVADPAFDGVAPECQVHRVQFSDEYGWRVRNVVVCP